MDATQLQHLRTDWTQFLKDAMPDETAVRVGAVGADSGVIRATVTLRGSRISIGFAVDAEEANDPTAVCYAFSNAVADAGYAGNVKVIVPIPPDDVPNTFSTAETTATGTTTDFGVHDDPNGEFAELPDDVPLKASPDQPADVPEIRQIVEPEPRRSRKSKGD